MSDSIPPTRDVVKSFLATISGNRRRYGLLEVTRKLVVRPGHLLVYSHQEDGEDVYRVFDTNFKDYVGEVKLSSEELCNTAVKV